MTLTQRLNAMEEAPSLRKSPFTLVQPSGLTAEECEHLAFCERHDFRAHETEVAACMERYRELRRAGDPAAAGQLERAKHIIDHLADL